MKKETEEWLNKAEKDLEDGIFNFDNQRESVAAFLFHQAIEKALKAIQIQKKGEMTFHTIFLISPTKSLEKSLKTYSKTLTQSTQGSDTLTLT